MISFVPLPERELISHIRQFAAKASFSESATRKGALVTGIGDDCAILRVPAGHEILVTTDFSLEGVHFRREWHSPEFVGQRCLTRGLSDIAAMGGQPVAVFLSLALPGKTPQRWIDGFLKGLLELAHEFGVPLAGGDTTQSPERMQADIVVLGSVPTGTAVLRSGACPGDHIYVTGSLGAAAAETNFLYAKVGPHKRSKYKSTVPRPRIAIGHFLRKKKLATAMIDISDGLSTDLFHICEESGVGARITTGAIPRAKFRGNEVELPFALHGGDAYELLFTAAKNAKVPARIDDVPVTLIGSIIKGKNMVLGDANGRHIPLKPRGWEHFRQRSGSIESSR